MPLTSHQVRTASSRTASSNSPALLLPAEIIHRIAYRCNYRTVCRFRSTCYWLRQWCKEADLRQYLLGRRRTYVWAAYKGRVDVLQRIDDDDQGEFWYCGGEFGREEVALGLGIVMRHKNVVNYAPTKSPKPLPIRPIFHYPNLRSAIIVEPYVHRALKLHKNLHVTPYVATLLADDAPIYQALMHHGVAINLGAGEWRKAIQFGSKTICLHLIDQNWNLLVPAINEAIQTNELDILRAIVHFAPTLPNYHQRIPQQALEFSAELGSLDCLDFFLSVGIRERNALLEGWEKGRAMCLAAANNQLQCCSKLAESEGDIYYAFVAAVTIENITTALENLIK
ncbi:hypothetical protein HK097_001092 [Rhizophlyctis rosea]|uniref:F-box domain-containing protein n=1 Tax=Rhizophlyctis rosea TaxID=64517 RepID=A0AAD5X102_9FUNG|nr:hypothetical protein HK097_001092 [Rhizophlyctis rosea]